jgi:hypothetical protein
MKKTTKPNPLKTFNDNKTMAYKKAGGAMDAFKKSLTKAQNGMSVSRPLTQQQAAQEAFRSPQNDPMFSSRPVPFVSEDISTPPIPYSNKSTLDERARKGVMDSLSKPISVPRRSGQPKGVYEEPKMRELQMGIPGYNKKGGSVKRKK